MKKIITLLLAAALSVSLASCKTEGGSETENAGVTSGTSAGAGSATYKLNGGSKIELAVWYSGDYDEFDVFYTKLEDMGYDLHDVSLKDDQLNFVYDYEPDDYTSESMSGYLKWTVPDKIYTVNGETNITVSFEGKGSLVSDGTETSPGVYADADIYTAAAADFISADLDYNSAVERRDYYGTVFTYDLTDGSTKTVQYEYTYSDSEIDNTILIALYLAFNDHYVKIIYEYDRVNG
jgi:hypothetical protein